MAASEGIQVCANVCTYLGAQRCECMNMHKCKGGIHECDKCPLFLQIVVELGQDYMYACELAFVYVNVCAYLPSSVCGGVVV
jgi:hypothetical protein